MIGLSSLSKARLIGMGAAAALLAEAAVRSASAGLLDWPVLMHAGLGLAVLGSVAYQRRVGRAVRIATAVCQDGAAGRFERRIVDIRERGDLGALLHAINDLIDPMDAFVREASASLATVAQGDFHRTLVETGMHGTFVRAARNMNASTAMMAGRVEAFQRATRGFETTAIGIAQTVSEFAQSLRSEAAALSESSDRTSRSIADVGSATDTAAHAVHDVGLEISRSTTRTTELGRRVMESAGSIGTAVDQACRAEAIMAELAKTAEGIGRTVSLIAAVTSRTHLLALNATIEAAHAGDAGRGFAVVATEVKALAGQSAQATEDISREVARMQSVAADAVCAIQAAAGTIGDLRSLVQGAAADMERQIADMRTMAGSLGDAGQATTRMTRHMTDISATARDTGSKAASVLDAADRMLAQAASLRHEVEAYVAKAAVP